MAKLYKYKTLKKVATRLKSDLNDHNAVLVYAFNGTGKTRLSMEFRDLSKKHKKTPQKNTIYYNAYTEDLFSWYNDPEGDNERYLNINPDIDFIKGFVELERENVLREFLHRYADFDFKIDYEKWIVRFHKGDENDIKISRGEESIFIWCIFLTICQLVVDEDPAYNWVKYIYIDDPISSLDDNNAITIACDLARILKPIFKKNKQSDTSEENKIKVVISSHHSLFHNVMYNELRNAKIATYFLHKENTDGYVLQSTNETPFFHHVALISELDAVSKNGNINTYHFNVLRSILEKTSTFFGYDDFSDCIKKIDENDTILFARALNLLSHGDYSIFHPVEMTPDNKDLFREILRVFLDNYKFKISEIFAQKFN